MDKLQRPGISLRAIAPNAVTAMALCTGLSGAWFAMQGRWEAAIAAIVGAGILDGMDGRIARMLKGESKFGAELDSLSDVTAFGVTPALVTYMWALQHMPRFGWSITVFFALCMALRLARFNARIDVQDQPHKSAGFNTGVPAPAGAGLALFPMIVWLETGLDLARNYYLVAPWLLFVALLMVSSIATFSWKSIRIPADMRFFALVAIAGFAAALITAPLITLAAVCVVYLALIPLSIWRYGLVKKARNAAQPSEVA